MKCTKLIGIPGLSLILLLAALSLRGQPPIPFKHLTIEELGVNQGLGAGFVWRVAQDSKGYLWIGNRQGLSRYDGYELKNFLYDANDSLSLPGNDLRWILPLPSGPILVKTHDEKMACYMPEQNAFFRIDFPDGYGPPLFVDHLENVWFRDEDQYFHILPGDAIAAWLQRPLPHSLSQSLESPGNRYPGFPDSLSGDIRFLPPLGLARLRHHNLALYSLENSSRQSRLLFRQSYPFLLPSMSAPMQLIEDKSRGKLFLFGLQKYCEIHPQTGDTLACHRLPDWVQDQYTWHCDAKSRVWMHINKEFCWLNLQDGQLSRLGRLMEKDPGLCYHVGCRRLVEDKDHNIWIPTSGQGVFKYAAGADRFHYWGDNHQGPSIQFLYAAGPESILIETPDQLVHLNRRTHKSTTLFRLDMYVQKGGKYAGFRIYPAKDNTWVITPADWIKGYADRLLRIDLQGNLIEVIHVTKGPDYNHWLDQITRAMNYGIWNIRDNFDRAPTNEKAFFFQMDKPTDSALHIMDLPLLANGQPVESIKAWAMTPDSSFWMGFELGGLYQLDNQAKKWVHHPRVTESSDKNLTVLSILNDPLHPEEILWVGTKTGLYKYNYITHAVKQYTVADGLPDQFVYGILSDRHNNLWLSTNQGLCNFNPQTLETRNFTREDGLQHNEFNTRALAQTADGTLFFGGVGGVTYFDPEEFYKQYPPSHVVINGLRLANERVDFSPGEQIAPEDFRLEKPIEALQEITFRHVHHMITFEFACLDLTRPAKNQFRYKLEGFNTDWIDARSQHEATYTNLPAGKYTFRVQGQNHAGVWNEKGASLKVIMLAPWWATWWFRYTVSVLVSLLIAGAIYYRLYQIRKLQNLRDRISRDLHDEIGSTLSSIVLYGTVAKKSLDDQESMSAKMMDRINQHTTEMMQAINDIVWAIKPNQDKVRHILQRMRAYTSELDEVSEVNLQFIYEPALENISLEMIQRRNFYLIFKEAINNAIKYAEADEIRIHLEKTGKSLLLTISDNGKGFNLEEAKTAEGKLGGNGLRNMQKRAAEIGGKFSIESEPHKGTTISVKVNLNTFSLKYPIAEKN